MARKLAILLVALGVLLPVAPSVASRAREPVRDRVAALERQVVALRTKVRRLARDNHRLRADLRSAIGDRQALRRALARETSCPVTPPNGTAPPGAAPAPTWHGEGRVWIALWTGPVVVAGDGYMLADGSIVLKFGWWRGVEGDLTIRGRRIDAAAPPLRADVPSGYGESGFQVSGIEFPTEGCWEISGTVGEASLTFVVLVVGR